VQVSATITIGSLRYGFVLEQYNELRAETTIVVPGDIARVTCTPLTMDAGTDIVMECWDLVDERTNGTGRFKAIGIAEAFRRGAVARGMELSSQSVAELQALLASEASREPHMSRNMRNALVILMEEKQVVEWWAKLAEETAAQLKSSELFYPSDAFAAMSRFRGLEHWLDRFEFEAALPDVNATADATDGTSPGEADAADAEPDNGENEAEDEADTSADADVDASVEADASESGDVRMEL
jgi:hypothetical protein